MKKKLKIVSQKIGSILSTLVLGIAIVLCLSVIKQVATNGYVKIGEISLFRVVTGSMEPELPIGSLLVCRETDIREICEEDIVCFRSMNPQILGEIVTHRVVRIGTSADGTVLLETKGDANLSADVEYVSQQNFIGKVEYYAKDSNVMAAVINLLTDKVGFFILILFPTLLIAGFILRSCMLNIRRNMEQVLQENEQAAQEELYTQEEYEAMLARIKNELLEEMKQGVEQDDEQIGEPEKTE